MRGEGSGDENLDVTKREENGWMAVEAVLVEVDQAMVTLSLDERG